MRIVVSGMIAADPFQGGATWAVLQYVLGFRALGACWAQEWTGAVTLIANRSPVRITWGGLPITTAAAGSPRSREP